jgi:hypothetical protein
MNLQYCKICNTQIIAMAYHIHIELCSGGIKCKKKIPDEIIIENFDDMKNIIQKLVKEVDNLKEEVELFRKTQKRKRISDILKERDCHIGYKEWIKNVNITYDDVDSVLKTNIIIGLKQIFENLLSCDDIPIAAFVQKDNKIYIYDTHCKWVMAMKNHITYMISVLLSKLFDVYSELSDKELEKYKKPKIKLTEKIYGITSECNEEKISIEIRKFLFTKLKINIEKDTIDDL